MEPPVPWWLRRVRPFPFARTFLDSCPGAHRVVSLMLLIRGLATYPDPLPSSGPQGKLAATVFFAMSFDRFFLRSLRLNEPSPFPLLCTCIAVYRTFALLPFLHFILQKPFILCDLLHRLSLCPLLIVPRLILLLTDINVFFSRRRSPSNHLTLGVRPSSARHVYFFSLFLRCCCDSY